MPYACTFELLNQIEVLKWSVFFHWLENQIEIICPFFCLFFLSSLLVMQLLISGVLCGYEWHAAYLGLLCSFIACTSLLLFLCWVVVPQGLWTTWILLFTVNYTPRFILTWSRGWSLMMGLTKGKGAKNRKYNWEWVNSERCKRGWFLL